MFLAGIHEVRSFENYVRARERANRQTQKDELLGMRSGFLTIEGFRSGTYPSNSGSLTCRCQCGRIVQRQIHYLKNTRITACHECTQRVKQIEVEHFGDEHHTRLMMADGVIRE